MYCEWHRQSNFEKFKVLGTGGGIFLRLSSNNSVYQEQYYTIMFNENQRILCEIYPQLIVNAGGTTTVPAKVFFIRHCTD